MGISAALYPSDERHVAESTALCENLEPAGGNFADHVQHLGGPAWGEGSKREPSSAIAWER
jgi:hypothetical protein